MAVVSYGEETSLLVRQSPVYPILTSKVEKGMVDYMLFFFYMASVQ